MPKLTPTKYVAVAEPVDAVRLTSDNWPDVLDWIKAGKPFYSPTNEIVALSVFTAANPRKKAEFGDWIVWIDDGNNQVLTPEEFSTRYEPHVEPTTSSNVVMDAIAAALEAAAAVYREAVDNA